MTEFLDWMGDGIVWMEDQIYEIYKKTDETFQSLSQLITDFDTFLDAATAYLYISGLALIVIFVMCCVNANNTKLLKEEIKLLREDLTNKEGEDVNGQYDGSPI